MASAETKEKEKVVKLLFVGTSGVGKTSLFMRYTEGVEPGLSGPTVTPDMVCDAIHVCCCFVCLFIICALLFDLLDAYSHNKYYYRKTR